MIPGYRLYEDVVSRLPEFRETGSGLRFSCPFKANHKNGDRHASAFAVIGARGELWAYCNGCGARWPQFVEWVGLPKSAWFPSKGARVGHVITTPAVWVEDYGYTDEHGEELAVKSRWSPGFGGAPKSFTWRRRVPGVEDGWAVGSGVIQGGAFVFDKKGKDGRRQYYRRTQEEQGQAIQLPSLEHRLSLYRLPDVLSADVSTPVLVVEGERKADRLAALGFVATTGYAGAGKWDYVWGCHLKGRRVCVIPDRDQRDVSLTYAYSVMASSIYYGSSEVRVVEIPLPELKPKSQGGDIVDWLDRKFPHVKWTDPGSVGRHKADMKMAVSALCRSAVPYTRGGA